MKFIVRHQRRGATPTEWAIVITVIGVIGLLCAGCVTLANVMHNM